MFVLTRGGINRHAIRLIESKRLFAAQVELNPLTEEYTEKPEYPEILDITRKGNLARKKELWYEEIKALSTVEEKLIKINMPRYYGYKTVTWDSVEHPYNCLPITQHYTRTIYESYDKLPTAAQGDTNVSKINSFVKSVSNSIQEAVEYSHEFYREKHGSNASLTTQQKDRILGQIIVENLNRTLINSLNADIAHLSEVEVDFNPRHEAFWAVGGVDPPKNVRNSRKGIDWQKDTIDMPVDRLIQYTGEPYLTLRHKLPLPPIKSTEESTSQEVAKKVPFYKFDPRTIGYKTNYRHGTNIPGFWPGSPSGFGVLSFQPRDHIVVRNTKYGEQDFKEVLQAHAIQSSFAWLLAQANYNGFSTYNDLTYPMIAQTIITNGKQFSFYRYQLNTTLIHSDHVHNNLKVNFCWGTDELNLYQEVDASGKCVGFNDDVVKRLVELYVNEPAKCQTDIQPYLSSETPRIADIEDSDKRVFLEKVFKHLVANRPRHLEIPETYLWEKIYKIDHKTRSIEPKRRFFELKINPWRRTLDQHVSEYIPKVVRPGGPKSKLKFKKTYYP